MCNGHKVHKHRHAAAATEMCNENKDCSAHSYCDLIKFKCCARRKSVTSSLTLLNQEVNCNEHSDCIGENVACISYKCASLSSLVECINSTYGCCDDGETPAKSLTECPKLCDCNPLGSQNQYCDPTTLKCVCKPGVTGKSCDLCAKGFWGLGKGKQTKSTCLRKQKNKQTFT